MIACSVCLGLTCLLSILLVPVGAVLGRYLGIVDMVGRARTIHKVEVPRTGGLVLGTCILMVLGVLGFWLDLPEGSRHFLREMCVGGLLIMVLGLVDDWRNMRARHKLAGQLVVASVVVAMGFRPLALSLPGLLVELPVIVSTALAVMWLVVAMNAVNLIDGMDGLAGGIAATCALGCIVLALATEDLAAAVAAAAIGGAALGFLRYNFHPASIFLGDCGSLFLGLTLGMLTMRVSMTPAGSVALLVPILLLAVPIVDMVLTVIRRLALGRPIFSADADHTHHRLLARGMSQPMAATLIYCLCASVTLFGLVFARVSTLDQLLLLGSVAGSVVAVILLLGYFSFGKHSVAGVRKRRIRNRAVRRALAEIGPRDTPDVFVEVASRVGPLLGAAGMTVVQSGHAPGWEQELHWTNDRASVVVATRTHVLRAGDRKLGTLVLRLEESGDPDLPYLIEALGHLLTKSIQAAATAPTPTPAALLLANPGEISTRTSHGP